jgi:hypothetical protein
MAKFIAYYYNQNTMVVVNFKDQIQPGTFEHTLHFLDPAILLKIILFAHSKGTTSQPHTGTG